MNELPLILIGGLLGSSHCIGMCGGFALSIGLGAKSPLDNLIRQTVYCLGRVFTYGFLGSAAGFAGLWFASRAGTLVRVQAWLSLTAGTILVIQGLATLGVVLPLGLKRRFAGSGVTCLASSFARPFLNSPKWESVFLAGLLNGLLPCGLVYGYLALASSTASLPMGLATMVAFGLGTMPAMILTGVGASLLSHTSRRRLFRIAGVCVLITGILAVGRGYSALGAKGKANCPACEPSESSPATPASRPLAIASPG